MPNRDPSGINQPHKTRSEEHTSELSHGYISYAVFCLKKKTRKPTAIPKRGSTPQSATGRGRQAATTHAPTYTRSVHLLTAPRLLVVLFFFFFLKVGPPPKSSPFPSPAPFRS